jgi:nucleoside-diphosphate-sugar epimerase
MLTTAGVDGIFHTASPIDFSIATFEKMVIPAMRGTEVLLASALKAGPQLKAVVVTSSVVAIIDPPKTPDHVYTEAEFATVNLERAIRERGGSAQTPGNVLYPASKTAADRAVWQFRNERKVSLLSLLKTSC